jgi:hypothetical protein
MMKPGPNYKMSALTKASLTMSRVLDPHKRGEWKRAMIDAELSAAVQPKRETRKQGNGNFTTHSSGTVSSGN